MYAGMAIPYRANYFSVKEKVKVTVKAIIVAMNPAKNSVKEINLPPKNVKKTPRKVNNIARKI